MNRRKQLEKKLWSVFSLYIRTRDNFTCICCGETKETAVIQCGHLIKRGKSGTKYDEKNNNAQCARCNFIHNYDPSVYTNAWLLKYGQKEYHKLCERKWNNIKYSLSELESMIEYYQEQTEKLKVALLC